MIQVSIVILFKSESRYVETWVETYLRRRPTDGKGLRGMVDDALESLRRERSGCEIISLSHSVLRVS